MTTYEGRCHCGHHEWTVVLQKDQQSHILCHCETCKILSGGASTMNQVVPRSALTITKGGEPACYSYAGDSGKPVHCYYCADCTTHIYHHQEVMGADTIVARTSALPVARETFGVSAEIYGKDKLEWEGEVAQTFPLVPDEKLEV